MGQGERSLYASPGSSTTHRSERSSPVPLKANDLRSLSAETLELPKVGVDEAAEAPPALLGSKEAATSEVVELSAADPAAETLVELDRVKGGGTLPVTMMVAVGAAGMVVVAA